VSLRAGLEGGDAFVPGGLEVGVVGESHYQDALTAIGGGKVLRVSVSRKVGHLPRPAAQAFAPVGRRLAEQQQVGICSATITGGWDRGDGDTGHFGVILDLAHPDQLP
jgi:hypothetical protein